MTPRITRSASVLSAAVALALGTMAQAAETRPGDPTGRPAGAATSAAPSTPSPSTSSTSAASPSGQAATAQAVRDVRMSELIGMDVRNARGERLGDVNDLVVDPVSGQVAYAVIGAGGFLGIGEKLSAFPMSSFKIAARGAQDTTTAAGRTLDNDGVRGDRGPVGSDRTPAERQAQGRTGALDNDGVPGDKGPVGSDRSASTGATAPSDRTAASGTSTAPTDRTASSASPSRMLPGRSTRDLQLVLNADPKQLKEAPNFDREQWPDWNDSTFRSGVDRAAGVNAPPVAAGQTGKLVRASELMDAEIRDAQNKEIGEIEDLVVDMSSGRVHYAVAEFERGWLQADKLVALPMEALRPSGEKGELTFSGDRSRLQQAPSFEKTAWPDLNAPTYRSDVERYMATWSGATPGSATTAQQTDPSRGTTASSPAGSPSRDGAGSGTRTPSSGASGSSPGTSSGASGASGASGGSAGGNATGSPPPATTPGSGTR